MFKPSRRPPASASPHRQPGFAETQFLHAQEDADYGGFAPTQMFGEDDVPVSVAAAPAGAGTWAACGLPQRGAPVRFLASVPPGLPAADPRMPPSWVTSRWVDAREFGAHDAARQTHELIAAQRRVDGRLAAPVAYRGRPGGLAARLLAACDALLPGEMRSLLPLFLCVAVTVALISAVLPLLDKP